MRIADHVSLSTIVSSLSLQSKGKFSSKSRFVCKCLFHSPDNNPSFNIYEYEGEIFYKCFSCGSHGHINQLYKKYLGKSVYSYFDLESKLDSFIYKQKKEIKLKQTKNNILKIEGDFISPYSNSILISYLNNRNIYNEFIDYFNIQYCKYAVINDKIIINDEEQSGTKIYDRFTIPIKNKLNETISYECRLYRNFEDKTRKNKKVIYPKNTNIKDIIFNINNLDFNKPVFITEGILDLNNLFTLGYRNIGAIMGNLISDEQINILNKFPEVNYFMDNDKPNAKSERPGELAVKVLDDKLEKEFYILKPEKEGYDPGKLSLYETEQCIKNKVLSINYFLNKHDLNYKDRSNEYKW